MARSGLDAPGGISALVEAVIDEIEDTTSPADAAAAQAPPPDPPASVAPAPAAAPAPADPPARVEELNIERAELVMSPRAAPPRRGPQSGQPTVLIDAEQVALDHAVAASVATGVRPAPPAPPLQHLTGDLLPPPAASGPSPRPASLLPAAPRGASPPAPGPPGPPPEVPRIVLGTPSEPPLELASSAGRPRAASVRAAPLPPIPARTAAAPARERRVLLIAVAAAAVGFALAYLLFR